GKLREAVTNFAEALRLNPSFPEALTNLFHAHNEWGNRLTRQRKFDEAVQHYTAALAAVPEQSSGLNNLGRALALEGKTAEAIMQFGEAVRLNPSSIEARCNLGYAFLGLGKTEQAASEFTQALRLKPDHQPAVEGL